MKKLISFLFIIIIVSSCAHKFQYTQPKMNYNVIKSKTVNMSKDQVWKKIISKLSETFFVINNIDKESGLINISYSGDPQKYVDCGEIYSYIENLRGKRTYQFPASSAHQEYEIWEDQLMPVKRNMSLEGRINIVVQEIEPEKTQVSVNSKYIITKEFSVYRTDYNTYQGFWQKSSETFSFNTGGKGTQSSIECICNGELEKSILDLIED